MSKESDKFVKEYKADKKKRTDLMFAAGDKLHKAMLAHLEKTWSAEDVLQEAVQKVRASGVTSKKSKDFVSHADVVKPLKAWEAMLKDHHKNLEAFTKFSNEVKTYNTMLIKRTDLVEKDLKKNSGMGDMEVMALIKEIKGKVLPDLKKSQDLLGSLKSFVVLYGTNYQRTIDAVVKDAIAAVTPKEFPASLAEDGRRKTEKTIKSTPKAIDKLCKGVRKAMEDGKFDVAEASLVKAEKELDALTSLAKDAKTTKTKMKKELKESQDSKIITKLITDITKATDKYTAQLDELEAELETKREEAAE
ncbi:hypothetical protein [Sulfitobacter noctilucicola]|uniref:Uncharacterized protein n=1 Tax=Sulfitobacter noctilucicola TaxID=1342301 RepID=A0A7W6Q584_9RHOB|nr:hypothetical protein [Sulfitobacter noctilucicola]MBB4173572.1 hypothetical protein [Sulfitobacter noctilucicola]